MKKIIALFLVALVMAATMTVTLAACDEAKPEGDDGGDTATTYVATFEPNEVIEYSVTYNVFGGNPILSSRGETFGIKQFDALTLKTDGTYEMEKTLKSTTETVGLSEPILHTFTFHGTYEQNGTTVKLSKAESATGSSSWGTIGSFGLGLTPADGTYNSVSSPGILGYFATPYLVEGVKNMEMTVYVNDSDSKLTFDETAFVAQRGNEGTVKPGDSGSTGGGVPEDAVYGKMPAPLVSNEEMKKYNLKNYFGQYNIEIGTAIKSSNLTSQTIAPVLLDQFSSVTLENDMKPGSTLNQTLSKQNGKLTVSFSNGVKTQLDWCKENGMKLRGHTLVWYSAAPSWIFREGFENTGALVDKDTMIQRMEDYIASFFEELEKGGWSDVMYCIDVVNEAIVAPNIIRTEGSWYEILGEDYIYYAFKFARKYAPENIKLVYNDFDIDAKADKVIELVKKLKDEQGNSLIDAIGHQGHYGLYSDISNLRTALKKIYDETGLDIQVTELDVSISSYGTLNEMKIQGQFYYNFSQMIIALKTEDHVNVTSVSLWCFTDAASWMPNNYMHLYDKNMVAKYAYFGMHGDYAHAGFDATDDDSNIGGYNLRFTLSSDTTKYIQLNKDGSYIDTATGSTYTGTYRASADGKTFTLYPSGGGSYAEISISADGKTATYKLSAGGSLQLTVVTQ